MPSEKHLDPPSQPIPFFSAGTKIPKIIHQIYFHPHQNLPAVLQENVRAIRGLNPGWEHRLYDDHDMAEFIGRVYGPKVLALYLRINEKYGAARADLFRYLLMYQCGGVYLDIKASVEKPLDSVLLADDVFLLSRWQDSRRGEAFTARWGMHGELKSIGGREFQQWHIMAAPGHPFLRAVIEKVLANIENYNPIVHKTGRAGVLWLSGPIAYTLAITPLLPVSAHRLIAGHEELGLIYSIFNSETFRAHRTIFQYHYTELTEPVVALSRARQWLWMFFGPIQIYVFGPARHFFEALMRRARRLRGLSGA